MMDIAGIHEYLPHRYPFLLVDRVTEVESGVVIKGYKNVSINEHYFLGHFPGMPVMPGVMILEAMAQISGILGFVTTGTKPNDNIIHFFAGADKTRFKKPVFPGDKLELEARLIAAKRNIWKFECIASVDGEIACTSEITTAERER